MVVHQEVPNILVAGKYRLTRLLGRGGMGSVWEGVHTTLGTRVAVKFIESEHLESTEARSRFENEARAAATLRSKHVVEVYDHGVAPDGRPFIVMEYLQGEPLDRRLERVGRLPAKDTARILQQVCRALGKAHAAGIVHRDLKPENIFLVWDDEDAADVPKLVDFGIAKFTDPSGASSATRTGSVLGTPYYMSPEQARGLRSVDHRADLWSLGVIAYRCVVGRLPFMGEAVGDVLVNICTQRLALPSEFITDAPPGFDEFIQRALARDPAERFQSAQEFSDALAVVCGVSVRRVTVSAAGAPPSDDPVYPPSLMSGSGPMGLPTPTVTHGLATGAPFTQTPLGVTSRNRIGKAFKIGAAAIAVLALGAVAVAKLFSPSPAEGGTASGTQPTAPAMTSAPPPQPKPAVTPGSLTVSPEVTESIPGNPEVEEPSGPIVEAPARRGTEPPATRPATRQVRRAPAPAPRPVAPAPAASRERPAPPATTSGRSAPIDVGY